MTIFRNLFALVLLTAATAVSAETIEMEVNGLVCAFCAQGIEKSLRGFDATHDVYVSLEHCLVAIELDDGADVDDAALREAITDAGYTVVAIRRSDASLQSVRDRVAADAHD